MRREMGGIRTSKCAAAGVQAAALLVLVLVLSTGPWASARAESGIESATKSVIEYRAPDLYPEGFDWDAEHGRFLLGSVHQGRIVSVTEQGGVEDFVVDEEIRRAGAMILGVLVDAPRDRVLAVATAVKEEGPRSALVGYDLESGRRTLHANLSAAREGGVANDVAVDREGNAYVTDSTNSSVWRVTPGGSASVFTAGIPQRPVVAELEVAKRCAANGIVYTDGHLLVVQTNSGALFRVRVGDASVREVEIRDGALLTGADGMVVRPDGSLVVVSCYTAWLLKSKDLWRTADIVEKVALNEADFTSTAAVNGRRTFILYFHLLEHLAGGSRDSFKIVEIGFQADANDDSPLWLLLILAMFVVLVLAWKYQLKRFNEDYTRRKVA